MVFTLIHLLNGWYWHVSGNHYARNQILHFLYILLRNEFQLEIQKNLLEKSLFPKTGVMLLIEGSMNGK